MTGRRVYCEDEGGFNLKPGDYVKLAGGTFLARVPDPRFHTMCLAGHRVMEHGDGTITVSLCILHAEPDVGEWHGFLERGVWRQV
jgi:hypothetical protein